MITAWGVEKPEPLGRALHGRIEAMRNMTWIADYVGASAEQPAPHRAPISIDISRYFVMADRRRSSEHSAVGIVGEEAVTHFPLSTLSPDGFTRSQPPPKDWSP